MATSSCRLRWRRLSKLYQCVCRQQHHRSESALCHTPSACRHQCRTQTPSHPQSPPSPQSPPPPSLHSRSPDAHCWLLNDVQSCTTLPHRQRGTCYLLCFCVHGHVSDRRAELQHPEGVARFLAMWNVRDRLYLGRRSLPLLHAVTDPCILLRSCYTSLAVET